MTQLLLPLFEALVAWHKERREIRAQIEAGSLAFDPRTTEFAMQLRDMLYDEAWCFEEWRLELVNLAEGHPHWRLYNNQQLYGIAEVYANKGDIGSSRKTPLVRQMLAAFLVRLGWDLDRVTVRRAVTDIDAPVSREFKLFKLKMKKKRKHTFDLLKETA